MERQQTSDESITTPRCDHVAVEESAEGTPEHRSKLQCLDPEIECKDEQENGNGLVIVATGHGS